MQQQIGVPPIIMQQVQPAFIQAIMQSQQPWIIAQQAASPLVQVTQQPSLVISTLQTPIVMLHEQTIIPFIMQQMLHMPPAIIVQRFCIMAQAALSSQVQVIFIPPVHFSIFIMQRGTMIMFGAMGAVPGAGFMPEVMPVIALRSIIIAVVIFPSPEGFFVHSSLTGSLPRPFFGPFISVRSSGSVAQVLNKFGPIPAALVDFPTILRCDSFRKISKLTKLVMLLVRHEVVGANMFRHNRRRAIDIGRLRRSQTQAASSAFVPLAIQGLLPPTQHAQVAEIYRIAAERTLKQFQPRRSWVREFSRN